MNTVDCDLSQNYLHFPVVLLRFLSAFQLSLFFFFFSNWPAAFSLGSVSLSLCFYQNQPAGFRETALTNQLNAEVLLARFRLQDDLYTPCSTSLKLLGVRLVNMIQSSIEGCIRAITILYIDIRTTLRGPALSCPGEAHLAKTTAINPESEFAPNSKLHIVLLTCGAINPSRSVCEPSLQWNGARRHFGAQTAKNIWIWKTQQQCVFPEIKTRLLKIIRRPWAVNAERVVAHTALHQSSRLASGLAPANLDGDKII